MQNVEYANILTSLGIMTMMYFDMFWMNGKYGRK